MVRVLSSGFSRYKIGVSYDGMYFSGWISQKFNFNGFRELSPSCIVKPSVTEILLLGLNKLVGVDNYENYKGSSRTDAGVHAVRNYFQVDIRDSCRLNSTAVVMGLNQKLNSYLKMRSDCAVFITDASLQTADFDAHALATGRVYLYRIQCPSTDNHLMRSQGSIFGKHRSWWISKPLDIDLMREAASYLVGEKDFSSFRAAGCDSPSPVKTLNMISIQRANDFQCPSNIDGHNFHNLIRVSIIFEVFCCFC